MKKLFLVFIFLSAFVSCGGGTKETDKCEGVSCSEWQQCNASSGVCEAKSGRCDAHKDCSDGNICDENHNCVESVNVCKDVTCSSHGICVVENNSAKCNCETGFVADGLTCIADLCSSVTCDEWKQCNPSNGACVLKTGRCNTNSDCSNNFTCDETHTCFNSSNPCENQTCSAHGTCVVENNSAKCNCETGFVANGLNCVDSVDFLRQWGTTSGDNGDSVAVDSSGNVFVMGSTQGGLDGNTNQGRSDIFLTKFDNSGNKLWTKQWGTTTYEAGNSVAVDSSGNIFVTGYTEGGLDGNTNTGGWDIFLTKFDNSGNKLWTKQWGTTTIDCGNSIAVDSSGNVFVTGVTVGGLDGNTTYGDSDIFLTKFDNSGNKLFTKQWGATSADVGNSVSVDSSGNVFVTGYTNINAGEDCNPYTSGIQPCYDIFLTKFDNSGNKLFIKQWGTTFSDYGYSVAIDTLGNAFVTGYIEGGLDGNTTYGDSDIFLTKFDNAGNKLWTKQWGTTSSDYGYSVAVDNSGNVFVTGGTVGGLDGNTTYGDSDIFLTKFDNSGNKLFTKQWGTTSYDCGNSIAVDSSGNVFVTGYTEGGLDGNTSSGGFDIFLIIFEAQ